MHSHPFVSEEEFVSGCNDLVEAFEAKRDAIYTWSTLEIRYQVSRHRLLKPTDPTQHGQSYLRILKPSQLNNLAEKQPEHEVKDHASNDVEEFDQVRRKTQRESEALLT